MPTKRPVADTDSRSASSKMARARFANPAATLGRRQFFPLFRGYGNEATVDALGHRDLQGRLNSKMNLR